VTEDNWGCTGMVFDKEDRVKLIEFLESKKLGDPQTRTQFIDDVESYHSLIFQPEEIEHDKTRKQTEKIMEYAERVKKDSETLISTLDKRYRETDEYIAEGMVGNSLKNKEPLDLLNARPEQILTKLKSIYAQSHDSLKLLCDSCEWILEATKPKKGHRGVSRDREFIFQVARCYSARFLKEPKKSRNGVFKQVLDEIAELSGTNIHTSETIIGSLLPKNLN